MLADQIRSLNLGWTRLKTGTPPRLGDARSIDWAKFEPAVGRFLIRLPSPFMTEKH